MIIVGTEISKERLLFLLSVIDGVIASESFGSRRHRDYVELRATIVARLGVLEGQ